MKHLNITRKGTTLTRVDKRVARRMYHEGRTILVFPVKANINSPWIEAAEFKNKSLIAFNTLVNSFEYYNCNLELGMYAKYFVKL